MNSDNDIVTRLRQRHCSHGNNYNGAYQPIEWSSTCERCELDREAADEIERLRTTNDAFIHVIENCMNEIERLRSENDWYKAVNTQLQADLQNQQEDKFITYLRLALEGENNELR